MTLHQLRLRVGDDDFFEIARTWAATKAGGNGSTPEFIALAEHVSGQQLDDLFQDWLFLPERPELGDSLRPAHGTHAWRGRGAGRADRTAHRAGAAALITGQSAPPPGTHAVQYASGQVWTSPAPSARRRCAATSAAA